MDTKNQYWLKMLRVDLNSKQVHAEEIDADLSRL